jgi:uncharacterized DUF497 family protein
VRFEWDNAKGDWDLTKHGVSFDEAVTTFYDPLAMLQEDEPHSRGERRFVLVGQSSRGRGLVTIFAERGESFRLVSSRLATPRERRTYEKGV